MKQGQVRLGPLSEDMINNILQALSGQAGEMREVMAIERVQEIDGEQAPFFDFENNNLTDILEDKQTWQLSSDLNLAPHMKFYGFVVEKCPDEQDGEINTLHLCIVSEAYEMDLDAFYAELGKLSWGEGKKYLEDKNERNKAKKEELINHLWNSMDEETLRLINSNLEDKITDLVLHRVTHPAEEENPNLRDALIANEVSPAVIKNIEMQAAPTLLDETQAQELANLDWQLEYMMKYPNPLPDNELTDVDKKIQHELTTLLNTTARQKIICFDIKPNNAVIKGVLMENGRVTWPQNLQWLTVRLIDWDFKYCKRIARIRKDYKVASEKYSSGWPGMHGEEMRQVAQQGGVNKPSHRTMYKKGTRNMDERSKIKRDAKAITDAKKARVDSLQQRRRNQQMEGQDEPVAMGGPPQSWPPAHPEEAMRVFREKVSGMVLTWCAVFEPGCIQGKETDEITNMILDKPADADIWLMNDLDLLNVVRINLVEWLINYWISVLLPDLLPQDTISINRKFSTL